MNKKPDFPVIYDIPHPTSLDVNIQVYGDPEMGWYEWRLCGGDIIKDTASEGRQYGNAEIALRDALIFVTQ